MLPIRNETSEHIDSALAALISDIETYLINWGALRVISHESQRALMEEIKLQSTDGFDRSMVTSSMSPSPFSGSLTRFQNAASSALAPWPAAYWLCV